MATFNAFNGADIVATFNGQVIGELQAITYNVARENTGIHEIGARPFYEGTLHLDYFDVGHGIKNPGKSTDDYYRDFNSDTTRKYFKNVRVNMKSSWQNEDYAQELLNKEEPF